MSKRKKDKKKRKKRKSVAGATRKRRESAGKDYQSQTFQLPDGVEQYGLKSTKTVRVDIIPYIVGKHNPKADKGELYWERTYWVHRNVGPNEDWIVCPARVLKKPCPVCEFVAKIKNEQDADDDMVRNLLPSKRMLTNVVDMSDRDKGIQVFDISHNYFGRALDEALTAEYEDDDENMDAFCDTKDGYYLK